MQRELGVSEAELVTEWRTALWSLGRDPEAMPTPEQVVLALGWIVTCALVGVGMGWRREPRR